MVLLAQIAWQPAQEELPDLTGSPMWLVASGVMVIPARCVLSIEGLESYFFFPPL